MNMNEMAPENEKSKHSDKPRCVPFTSAALDALGEGVCRKCVNASYERYENSEPPTVIRQLRKPRSGEAYTVETWPADSVMEGANYQTAEREPEVDEHKFEIENDGASPKLHNEWLAKGPLVIVTWFRVYCAALRQPVHRPAQRRTCMHLETQAMARERNLEKEAQRKSVTTAQLKSQRAEPQAMKPPKVPPSFYDLDDEYPFHTDLDR